jgi:pyruvate kinase
VKIIAKIERPAAVDVIEEIIEASDAIMVARGDLGVELPAEAVPVIQRELISLARSYGKPVIVATQMLESMIEHPQPTRAEVSDVSTAVFSSADAVMLSAETAAGAFPVRAVEMMDRIARRIEASQWAQGVFRIDSIEPRDEIPMHAAVARSTAQLSRDLRVRAIITLDRDLTAARVVASARPAAPLIVVSDDASACRQANLLWGVLPIFLADAVDDPIALARRLALELGLAEPGQFILLVTGLGPGAPSDTAPAITALRT